MKTVVKLLLVEDNVIDRRLVKEILSELDDCVFDIQEADRLSAAQNILKSSAIDVVILDLGLPDSSGLDTFYKVHKEFPNLPIVIVSGFDNEDVARRAVQDGAHDFIVKGKFNAKSLLRSIRYAMKRQQARVKMQSNMQASFVKASSSASKEIVRDKAKENILKKFVDHSKQTNSLSKANEFNKLTKDYEALLESLVNKNLTKSNEHMNMIKELARKLYDNNFLPEEVDELRAKQSFLPSDNILLFKVNTDILSEMVCLVYQDIYQTSLKQGKGSGN